MGTTIFIPDIAPLPSRDALRSLMEEAVRQTTAQASHLRDWFEPPSIWKNSAKATTRSISN
ncbi:hypothetical protein GC163_16250 [bacterium]|nr:hypothetical protein [bacterium]